MRLSYIRVGSLVYPVINSKPSSRRALTYTPKIALGQVCDYPQGPVRLRQKLAITGSLDQGIHDGVIHVPGSLVWMAGT